MKYFITFNLLAITTINPLINAHENHVHEIYNWSNKKNRSKKSDSNINVEKFKEKENKTKTKNSSILKKFFIK